MKALNPPFPIILASTSPRRIDLMGQVGLAPIVLSPHSLEKTKPGEKPNRMVLRLAQEKAESVQEEALDKHEHCLILAADTIVVSPDRRKILGKPKDEKQAIQMLKSLSGKTHSVFTGYTLLQVDRWGNNQKVSRVVRSTVKMRALKPAVIARYVASGEPLDKAGSYAAQGLGMALIEEIRGSYTNVVGLPLSHVLSDLEKFFDFTLFSWVV